jgi:uncharacterized protein YjbJ (UPF0337 family)
MAKEGYEPIPDVEKGEVAAKDSAKARYPELDDDQADLIFSLDEAIAGSSVDLPIPRTSPEELISQGKGFLRSIVTPTLTSICTALVALYLSTMEEAGPWIEMLFPYVNATIVFAASVAPMKGRFMTAVTPVFDQVERVQEKVDRSVQELGDTFNSSLDVLQAKAEKVMEPIKPTLAKAQPFESKIKASFPDAELPDQDLDEEFNEMRELVQPKLDEAKEALQLDESIPWFLRTPQAFFWSVVFPILLIAFAVQLVAAWFTTSIASAPGEPAIAASELGSRMLMEAVGGALGDQAQSLKGEAHDAVGKAKEEAGALRDGAKAGYAELHAQAQAGMDELHGEFDSQVAGAKVMLTNVAVSYGMSLLQVGVAFLISSPTVRAWIIDLLIRMMKAKAMRALREKGVETAFEDVFQTKMTKTRDTLLKIIGYYQKISSIVNVPSLKILGLEGDASSTVAALGNVLTPTAGGTPEDSSAKKSKGGLGGLSRMFSGKSPKK